MAMLWQGLLFALMFGSVFSEEPGPEGPGRCPLQWTTRISNRRLRASTVRVRGRMSESACMTACEEYAGFECLSIRYRRAARICRVCARSHNTLNRPGTPAAHIRWSPGHVYRERTQKCRGCQYEFTFSEVGYILRGPPNERFIGKMSEEDCLTECSRTNGFRFCLAVNYNNRHRKCYLMTHTRADRKPHAYEHLARFTYHERSLVCSVAADPCDPSPCQNEGTCISIPGGYICRCLPGWGGLDCQYKPAECRAYGDVHYTTFDGWSYDFQGVGKYILVKLKAGAPASLEEFRVLAKNEHRNGVTTVSWQRYIEVEIAGFTVRIGPSQEVYVDGVLRSLPVMEPLFQVINNGLAIRFQTQFGLVVQSEMYTSSIFLPPDYQGWVEGLCGTYDENALNDPTTREGDDVSSDPNGFVLFGNSWQIVDPEDPDVETIREQIDDPCTPEQRLRYDSLEFCGQIKNRKGPFGTCVQDNPTVSIFSLQNCIYDLCATAGSPSGDKEKACWALENFADACVQLGAGSSDWRNVTECLVTCPEGLEYAQSATACPATCAEPSAPEFCALPDTETCACPEGQLLRKGECVPPEDCNPPEGCTLPDGTTVELEDSVSDETCVVRTCEMTGNEPTLVVVSDGCDDRSECVDEGELGFICTVPFR